MVFPALQVRVPSAANALLQAEQIKTSRAQNQAIRQQQEGRNALLTAFQGGIPTNAADRAAAVNTVAQSAPFQALELQQRFGQLNAQDQAQVAAEGAQIARGLFGVRDQASYAQARNALGPVGQGLPEQYNPQLVQSTINQARSIDSLFSQSQGFTLTPGATRFDAQGNPVASVLPRSRLRTPEEFDQEVALRRAGSPTTNVTGGATTVNLTPGATTALQKDVLDTQGLRSRLDTIASGFRPEFLELPTQVGQSFNAFRERVLSPLGVGELSAEQQQALTNYTTFQRDTVNNLSQFVSDLSGAAVTPDEAERLGNSLPLMTDSPSEFQAKLVGSARESNRALARASFALTRGLDPLNSGITLEGIEAVMAQEETRLRQALVGQVPPDQVEAEVERQLRALFGL